MIQKYYKEGFTIKQNSCNRQTVLLRVYELLLSRQNNFTFQTVDLEIRIDG